MDEVETIFGALTDDVEEGRRNLLSRYAILLLLDHVLTPPPVSSRALRLNCGRCMKKTDYSNLLTMFKTPKMCPCSSKTCERLSKTSRSVHDCQSLLNVDQGNR